MHLQSFQMLLGDNSGFAGISLYQHAPPHFEAPSPGYCYTAPVHLQICTSQWAYKKKSVFKERVEHSVSLPSASKSIERNLWWKERRKRRNSTLIATEAYKQKWESHKNWCTTTNTIQFFPTPENLFRDLKTPAKDNASFPAIFWPAGAMGWEELLTIGMPMPPSMPIEPGEGLLFRRWLSETASLSRIPFTCCGYTAWESGHAIPGPMPLPFIALQVSFPST